MPLTMEQAEEKFKQIENKLLALEQSNDPKAKETIAELRAQLDALAKKLDKAKEEKPADPPPLAPPAAAAAPGGKPKEDGFPWD